MSGAAFPYTVDAPSGAPRLGLIVLQVDETVERDFRHLLPVDTTLHVSRVPSGADLTPDTIAGMEHTLAASAALLPPAAAFDVVGYACTSASTQLGAERVEALVHRGARTRHVTNPFSASLAAFEALGLRRIAIVSPYVAAVSDRLIDAFRATGLDVAGSLSFGEGQEARVARIAAHSLAEAARQAARLPGTQAVFLSCTNLRTLGILAPLEAELRLPVLSSNQALAWHMARLAGLDAPGVPGRLGHA
jgi:maleate isomerase